MSNQNQSKICGTCKINKPFLEFPYRNKEKGTVRSICKYCANKANRPIQRAHKEKYAPVKAKNYRDHRTERLAQTKARRTTIRNKILFVYGSKCSCCGETEPEFLTLEHLDKDGSKHRKAVGGCTTSVYLDVINRGYPENFTLLCYNCNCSQKFSGICPHKRK